MKGIYHGAQEIVLLKEGGEGKKAWKLYGADIIVDGESYGISAIKNSADAAKKELQDKLDKLKPGMLIEFETEERGNYVNVKQKTEIKILAESSANYTPPAKPAQPAATPQAQAKKPTIPFMKDEEIFTLMDSCIKAVNKSLADQQIVVQSLEETTTMINSVFIACREERKGARRWE
jgi:hypothetical protein